MLVPAQVVVRAEAPPRSFAPGPTGHATEDNFIKLHHSQRLSEAYAGEYKNLVTFAGDHNSRCGGGGGANLVLLCEACCSHAALLLHSA